jgi:RNA polymerase sigma-70 factor (ECF subfamily)
VKPVAKVLGSKQQEPSAVVHHLPVPDGDAALVGALRGGHPGAADVFVQRYVDHVKRVVIRVMNVDAEIEDIIHDVFLDALRSIDRLKEPDALKTWVTSIAVFKARRVLRQRRRRNWLRLAAPEELDRIVPASGAGSELAEAMHCTYVVLNELPTDERIAFALRYIEGMELVELAEACRTSVATVRRRLQRAQERFLRKARRYPVLCARIAEGSRWAP